MELREFMEKWKVSERDIIEAAKLTSSICGSFDCENCPFDSNYGCLITVAPVDVNIGEEVKKRIQEFLHPNHMEKVAEMLGVKLGQQLIVKSRNDDEFYCYLDKEGLKLAGDKDADCRNLLGDMLTGKAYIVKKEKKDE